MFLIRTAFWLSVVIFLIPVNEDLKRQAAAGDDRPIDAFEAVQVAQSAIDDAGGFCVRNPDTCAIGGRIATTFMLKARSGAMMLVELLDEGLGETAPVASAPARETAPTAANGTLTPADLEPAWQGPDRAGPV